tara:strand:+ start:1811 stop:2425 length:615 start_codon:yes stop_codon:yes gene_type:complete
MTALRIVRRTQQERSAETIEKILKATLDTIYDDGFQNATTSAIALKAGVSRGALLHHFPKKERLIAEAVRHMLSLEIVEIKKLAENVSADKMSLNDFLDEMWAHFSGRLFMTTIEYLAAARTDQYLREELKPLSLEFNKALDEIWLRFFKSASVTNEEKRLAFTTTICLLRGMAVNSMLRDDKVFFIELLAFWKEHLRSILKYA